jgi:fatty acid desaturase
VNHHQKAGPDEHWRLLRSDLAEKGTFGPARTYHVVWFSSVLVAYLVSYAVLLGSPGPLVRAVGDVVAAASWVQMGLFAHEVGHGAVTTNPRLKALLGHMGAILVVPHLGMGTQLPHQERAFSERQIRFSRNYRGGYLVALMSGGLNRQIEHHLLPHVPYVRLSRAVPVVRGYCARHDIPYRETGYVRAWVDVLAHLRRMGRLATVEGQTTPEPEADVALRPGWSPGAQEVGERLPRSGTGA